MSRIYTRREKASSARAPEPYVNQSPSIAALAAGARPTAEQMGSRVDLPEGIREKMESSFGADFSNVKLYESQTVADAGAQAVTQGTNIAFAPGKLDLTSTAGQALLGHELSHVVSQARGESAGSGFLKDAALEAQADRQGMMAAQGQSVYTGPVSPVGTSSAASAAGPMQAKKPSFEEWKLRRQISSATSRREVSFGDADMTMGMRAARFNQENSTLNHNNGPLMDNTFLEGATAMTGSGATQDAPRGDLLTAYSNRFSPQERRALRQGTTSQALPSAPLTLGLQRPQREERLTAAQGWARYNAAHPVDALSRYDNAIADGHQSIMDLLRRRRGATGTN